MGSVPFPNAFPLRVTRARTESIPSFFLRHPEMQRKRPPRASLGQTNRLQLVRSLQLSEKSRGDAKGENSLARARSVPVLKSRKARELPVHFSHIGRSLYGKAKQRSKLRGQASRATLEAAGKDPNLEALVQSVVNSLQTRYEAKASLGNVFLNWDLNRDGAIDANELSEVLEHCGCNLTKEQGKLICEIFGTPGTDKIPYENFMNLIYRDEVEAEKCKEPKIVDLLADRLSQLGLDSESIERIKEDQGEDVPISEVIHRLQKKFQAKRSLARAFRLIDDDRSGTINAEELVQFMNRQNIYVPKASACRLFNKFDRDGDGRIQFDEFAALVFPARHRGAYKRLTPREYGGEAEDEEEEEESEGEQENSLYSPFNNEFEGDMDRKKRMVVTREHFRHRGRDSLSRRRRSTNQEDNAIDTTPEGVSEKMRTSIITARIRRNISQKLSSDFESVATAFNAIDKNGDGRLSYGEFKAALMNLDLQADEVDIFLRFIDQDGNGFVDSDEFGDFIEGRFGASKVSSFKHEDVLAGKIKKEEKINKKRLHAERNPDHELRSMKTATVANVGFAFSNRIPNTLESRRIKLKRTLFPVTRSSTKEASMPRASSAPNLGMKALKARRRHLTTKNLISPASDMLLVPGILGGQVYEGGERGRFKTETISKFNLNDESCHHKQPEQVRKRQLHSNKLARIRRSQERHERCRKFVIEEDPDRHLKSILKQRLNYHARLDRKLEKERIRREAAGF